VEESKQVYDNKCTADGRPTRWKQSATELAEYRGPTKQGKSFTNIIFDTLPDNQKKAFGKKTHQDKEAVEKCPLCAQKDSQ
jgi:hypothetical protein